MTGIESAFHEIINFHELYCLNRPDEQTYSQRDENLKAARNYFMTGQNDRHSLESHMQTLQDVCNELEIHYRESIVEKNTYSQGIIVLQYESCMSKLKMLMIKCKLRMLLHDLRNINDSI